MQKRTFTMKAIEKNFRSRIFVFISGVWCIISQFALAGNAQDFLFSGQLSAWGSANKQEMDFGQLGARYIPSLSFSTPLSTNHLFDVEASVKTFGIIYFQKEAKGDLDKDFSAYRLWARFSGAQYELRVGLQKINFGSASIFRPLMWFDTIDPRDPLQITSGVYGILGRYYFLNNANIWVWGLIGNEDLKGWEQIPTAKEAPEFGGRIQVPLLTGEGALSYHYRQLDLNGFVPMLSTVDNLLVPENRIALDGKWDVGIGLWFEGVITYHRSELLPYDWEQTFNVGIDYTFALGNGLNVLTEYFALENTNEILQPGEGAHFSAFSVKYPFDVMDNINAIVYYDWDNSDLYRFLSFQRNYDNLSIYLFAFWNPDEYKLDSSSRESSQFAGKGIQLMLVFNH